MVRPNLNRWSLLAALVLLTLGLAFSQIAVSPAQAQDATGRICVAAYNDANRNHVRDAIEPLVSNVVVSLLNEQSVVVQTYVTTGTGEPFCFDGLGAGNYAVMFGGGMLAATGEDTFTATVTDGQAIPVQFQYGAVTEAAAANSASPSATAAPDNADLLLRGAIALVGTALVVVVMTIIGVLIYWRRYRVVQEPVQEPHYEQPTQI